MGETYAKLRYADFHTPSWPVHVGRIVLTDDTPTLPHYHDFREVFWVETGVLHHKINGETATMHEGDLQLIDAPDTHYFRRAKSDATILTNIAFPPTFEKTYLHPLRTRFSLPHTHRGLRRRECDPVLRRALLRRVEILRTVDSYTERLATVHSILADLHLIFLLSDRAQGEDAPPWLTRACEMMRKESNYLHGISRFVAISGRTQEHLTRQLKRFYALTPSQFVNAIRLERAADLLIHTDRTVLEIAYQSGFNNISYFNRLFRSKYGMSPSMLRAKNGMVFLRRDDLQR